MKKTWMGLGFCLLMSLAGCGRNYSNFEDPTLSVAIPFQPEKKKTLEEQLFEDAADGKIDMPLERAALIAGECGDNMVDYYSDELKKLTSDVLQKVEQKKSEEIWKKQQKLQERFRREQNLKI